MKRTFLIVGILMGLLLVSGCVQQTDVAEEETIDEAVPEESLEEPTEEVELRSDVEEELIQLEEAYQSAPDQDDNRRVYANSLYKLGDMWQANEVIAPLATFSSSNIEDLNLGAELAYLLGDYARAEVLFKRLADITEEDSEAHIKAVDGLVKVYYQTNQYDKAKELTLPSEDQEAKLRTLLIFLQRFEGQPYQIEWATPEKVAHLPITNDFTPDGALPIVKFEINGHPVEFILDTGGDMLFIDEAVAEKVGVRNIAKRESKYAYTQGEYVEEPLGVVETVKMGEVTLKNVPVVVAKWKEMGPTSDGVITTQILKQFLTTVDYENSEITFRERSAEGMSQFSETLGDREPHQVLFFMAETHLMFAKGSLNGHERLNMFMDSGLAASMPLIIPDETAEVLEVEKNPIEGTPYYWSPIESHGIGSLTRGSTQALGNVLVEENSYCRLGFIFDALISHQYLRHLGSWTIDFDSMTYYFPAELPEEEKVAGGVD